MTDFVMRTNEKGDSKPEGKIFKTAAIFCEERCSLTTLLCYFPAVRNKKQFFEVQIML